MNRKKRIAIIGTNGLPATYGGFETLANYISLHLQSEFNFLIFCSKRENKEKITSLNGSRLIYFPLKANGWQSVIYDALSILYSFLFSDVLLILGPTSSGALIFLNKIFAKKIIVNYGGVEWKRQMHSKFEQRFAKFNCRVASRYANYNIADNLALKEILLNEFDLESCEIIEYGGDHVSCETINSDYLSKYPFLNEKFYFSLGRCQSDNNQHLLLESFKDLPNSFLVAVSNWDHNTYGKLLRDKYSNYSNIIMLDPIYNQKEIDVLRSNCYVYIHSHSQCGTAPSLVEAMNLDNAIISFDVATNRVTTNNKAFYFNDKKSLISILENTSINDIDKNRKDMTEISKGSYTWNRISNLYSNLLRN